MRHMFACIIAFAIFQDCYSQAPKFKKVFSNTLSISGGTLFLYTPGSDIPIYFPESVEDYLDLHVQQIGMSYERRIDKHWILGISYRKWGNDISIISANYLEHMEDSNIFAGWHSYKMIDVYGVYQINIGKSYHHKLNIGSGPSYTWGINSYQLYRYTYPGGFDATYAFENKKQSYWGAMTQLGYEYIFLKNRICIGGMMRLRFYINRPGQIDSEFKIGVNF